MVYQINKLRLIDQTHCYTADKVQKSQSTQQCQS